MLHLFHPHKGRGHPHHPGRHAMGRHGMDRFGGPESGWDREEGRHGGRRRMFDGDALKLILLKLLSEQPRHGYDLIREIETLSGGAYVPSPGMIYPALTLLNDMELIEEQEAEKVRKQYAVTPAGLAHLEEHQARVVALMARLAELASHARERSEGEVPVRRAMGNLRMVLQNRRMHGSDSETLHRVAEILDEAARQIERL